MTPFLAIENADVVDDEEDAECSDAHGHELCWRRLRGDWLDFIEKKGISSVSDHE